MGITRDVEPFIFSQEMSYFLSNFKPEEDVVENTKKISSMID
jgi:hypothetical protein